MPPYTGDADIHFNKQMRIHHLAAIDMAEVQFAQGTNPEPRRLRRRSLPSSGARSRRSKLGRSSAGSKRARLEDGPNRPSTLLRAR